MSHAPETEKAPFFIVGCSRSGTTLLQVLIDAHPNLAMPPESHIYDRFGPFFHLYGDLSDPANRARFIRDLLHDHFIRQWDLSASVEDIERRLKRKDRVGVIDALFSMYAERSGATRWGDKTPERIRHLRQIKADFPNAKLIHLVRDGRDVAEAMRRMVFGPVSAIGLAEEWRREVSYWNEFCRDRGREDTLVLRYEDLVTSPQQTVFQVLKFLGEPEIDTVDSYTATPLTRTLGKQRAWHSSLAKGIDRSKIGIYRNAFTRREIEQIESIAGDTLAEYGYTPEHEAPRAPTRSERQHAWVTDRLVRWTRKLRHPAVVHLELQFRLRAFRARWAPAAASGPQLRQL